LGEHVRSSEATAIGEATLGVRWLSVAAELDVALRVEQEPQAGDHLGVELEELGEAAGAPG
jgi:hypothetical protein